MEELKDLTTSGALVEALGIIQELRAELTEAHKQENEWCAQVIRLTAELQQARQDTAMKCVKIAETTVECYENDHGRETFMYGKNTAQAIKVKFKLEV